MRGASGRQEEEGADHLTLSAETVAIARRLALSAKRVIGFLPSTARRGEVGVDVDTGMMGALAVALSAFVPGEVGVIGDWRGWREDGGSSPLAAHGGHAEWRSHPGVVPVVPRPASDRAGASVELRKAISVQPARMARLLINLADLASPGVLPSASDWMDGVALLVNVRRARWRQVARLVSALPLEKQLGVIVLPAAPPAALMLP